MLSWQPIEELQPSAGRSPGATDAATFSSETGHAAVAGMIAVLNLIRQPALALDPNGCVLGANAAAEAIFDDDLRVRGRRLLVRDRRAAADLAALVHQLPTAPDTVTIMAAPIIVRRDGRRPLVIHGSSLGAAARGSLCGACVLLVVNDLRPRPGPDPSLIARAFGLTRAEARLASLVASGMVPDQAARRIGVSRETARSQLKAVYAKTDTHRQSELVALLLRLASLLLAALSLELSFI